MPLQNVRTECMNMKNVHTESIKECGCSDRMMGKKKNQELGAVCGFILSSITPITDEYLLSILL